MSVVWMFFQIYRLFKYLLIYLFVQNFIVRLVALLLLKYGQIKSSELVFSSFLPLKIQIYTADLYCVLGLTDGLAQVPLYFDLNIYPVHRTSFHLPMESLVYNHNVLLFYLSLTYASSASELLSCEPIAS